MIERLLLFGATGDLAGRYLLPAMAELLSQEHYGPRELSRVASMRPCYESTEVVTPWPDAAACALLQ